MELKIVTISYQNCAYIIKDHIKNEESKCVNGEEALKMANVCINDFYENWLNGRYNEENE